MISAETSSHYPPFFFYYTRKGRERSLILFPQSNFSFFSTSSHSSIRLLRSFTPLLSAPLELSPSLPIQRNFDCPVPLPSPNFSPFTEPPETFIRLNFICHLLLFFSEKGDLTSCFLSPLSISSVEHRRGRSQKHPQNRASVSV